MKTTSIGQMRERVILKEVTGQTDDGYGGLTAGTLVAKREHWVSVTEKGRQRILDNGQQVFKKELIFLGRVNSGLPPVNGNIVTYRGQDLAIKNILPIGLDYIEITAAYNEA